MAGQIVNRGKNTWYVRIFLGRDANGKPRLFNKTIHGTKSDAQKFLTAKMREKDLGTLVEPATVPLSQFLDRWLDDVASVRVRESTFGSYKVIVRNYITPAIGAKRLSDIMAQDVQKLYNDLLKRGLAARTVRYSHSVLSSAMKQAVKWRMLPQNPCDLCDLPRHEKGEIKCFSKVEAQQFLAVANKSKHYALFLTALETGMRPGEYLSMRWEDIDFETNTIRIRRSLTWNRKGGGFSFTPPKTKKSRRSIPISESTVKALKLHRKRQLETRLAAGLDYVNLDLVFATDIGTPMHNRNLDNRHFKVLIKRGGLKMIRLYDLRHTMATLLLIAGENPKVVSERLGHSSVVITLDTYSHVLPTIQETATDKLERMLFTA